MVPTPASPSPDSNSEPGVNIPLPLSNHIALWVLLTIITNTIAQASFIHNDERIYYHSSPLYSLADSLWTLIKSLIWAITLRSQNISTNQSLQLAINVKQDDPSISSENVIVIQKEPSKTWPRWIFFIMGPLPATIKLCSFKGVPWTQALGLMSLSAFVLNEIYLLILHGPLHNPASIAEILHLTEEEWLQEEKRELRKQIEKTSDILAGFTALAYFVLGLLNFAFLFAVAMRVWNEICEAVNHRQNMSRDVLVYTELVLNSSVLLSWLLALLAIPFRESTGLLGTIAFHVQLSRTGGPSIMVLLLTTILPTKNTPDKWSWIRKLANDLNAVTYFPLLIFWVIFKLLRMVVRRWPVVGEAMFLVKMEGDKGSENVAEGEVVMDRYLSLCFFLSHLSLAVLWFEIVYDERGTTNPVWTEIFGR